MMFAQLRSHHAKSGQAAVCLHRVDGVGEHVGGAEVFPVMDEVLLVARKSDEAEIDT